MGALIGIPKTVILNPLYDGDYKLPKYTRIQIQIQVKPKVIHATNSHLKGNQHTSLHTSK